MAERKTPLFDRHTALNGRMVPFAGWLMPVQYSSIIEEHLAVRNDCGIFDVSHMGEIRLSGSGAEALLESISCNRLSDLAIGKVQYNVILNKSGGLIDDITIYREGDDSWFIVSNAANYASVVDYLNRLNDGSAKIEDLSDHYHLIALQGPRAEELCRSTLSALGFEQQSIEAVGTLHYYNFIDIKHPKSGRTLRFSRTGYSGEDGYEIYSDIESGLDLWDTFITPGAGASAARPCGLGARDSLRLESGYPLYGHELDTNHLPTESGIGWIVKEKEIPYPAYEKILQQKREGAAVKLFGFRLLERSIPRPNYTLLVEHGGESYSAEVLSGAWSPVLQCGIGTVRLPSGIKASDATTKLRIRNNKEVAAELQSPRFVRGTAGQKSKG